MRPAMLLVMRSAKTKELAFLIESVISHHARRVGTDLGHTGSAFINLS
jgi:hypothetical protein